MLNKRAQEILGVMDKKILYIVPVIATVVLYVAFGILLGVPLPVGQIFM